MRSASLQRGRTRRSRWHCRIRGSAAPRMWRSSLFRAGVVPHDRGAGAACVDDGAAMRVDPARVSRRKRGLRCTPSGLHGRGEGGTGHRHYPVRCSTQRSPLACWPPCAWLAVPHANHRCGRGRRIRHGKSGRATGSWPRRTQFTARRLRETSRVPGSSPPTPTSCRSALRFA